MGSALRVLLAIALILSVGLSACGKRGSLDRPKPCIPRDQGRPLHQDVASARQVAMD